MVFKLELINNKIFKTIFESITKIIDEVTLICDSDGIHLSALDRSHITFVELELDKTLFDTYQCDVPEKISIDCEEFLKVLKRMKTSDILELTIDEGNLVTIFKGDSERKFNIRLIDLEYEPASPPNINHPIKIRVPSQLLVDALADMEIYSDKLTFTVDQDYFKIYTRGNMGDSEISYIHGEQINETATSTYNIPKLQDIMKASKFSEECLLQFGDNMPLSIRFELVTGDGTLSYLLAPRIEIDE